MTATLRLHGGGSVSEEGKGVECGQLEMAGVGVGEASLCIMGAESKAYAWVMRAGGLGDRFDRRGPWASEKGARIGG